MQVEVMSDESIANVLADTALSATSDINCAFIHTGVHPEFGSVIMIAGMSGKSALIRLNS